MEQQTLIDKAENSLENGDSAAALDYAEQALALEDSVDARLLLAEALLESGSLESAWCRLEEGLKIFPEAYELFLALGDLEFERDRGEASLEFYHRALQLEPSDAEIWSSMAAAQLNLDQPGAAEESAVRALELDPEAALALSLLGDISLLRGQTDAAEDYYEQARDLDPDDPQPYLSLAELYYDCGEADRAETYCQQALQRHAGLAEAYLTLGYVCLDQDRHSEARDAFSQFLRLEKNPAAEALRNEVTAVLDGLK